MDIDNARQSLLNSRMEKLTASAGDLSARTRKEKDLKEACADFEAVMLSLLMKSMRNSLPGNALFGESNGMNIYQSMHDQYLADRLADSPSSFGIRDFLFEHLKKSL